MRPDMGERALPRIGTLLVCMLAGAFAASATDAQAPVGWTASVDREVAPGVRYLELERGEVADAPRWDVVVASSSKQSAADGWVWRVLAAGFEPTVLYGSGRYEIRVIGLADRASAERTRTRLSELGAPEPPKIVESAQDIANPGGPWVAHLLVADPGAVEVRALHARDATFGQETTTSIARRHGALAAINGGFYLPEDDLAGDSAGTLVVAGRLLSEPDRGRGTVGFYREEGRVRTIFGRPTWSAIATLASGDQIAIDGIDRRRRRDEAIVYTPEFHRRTLTEPGGVEATVVGGRIVAVRDGLGGSEIPADGFVLSVGPARSGEDGIELRVGESVSIESGLASRRDDPGEAWSRAESAVSAGPLLLAGGEPVGRPELEAISQVFSRARHPRTAVGVRADGTLLLLAVEGRRPERSVGMSLEELTALLEALGAVDAVNLDGGGSTAMVVRDELVTTPSDARGERENGDALLLFPAPEP
ncbi:MAG: phosphodiester glycosidase family protein [Acidobacteria bacterium]|nr:phosphodiester glycosidase family protein [Acidobacteriota bacterium]